MTRVSRQQYRKRRTLMDYGIDSGGSNYRVEAQDTDGHQLGYYVGQPVNHYNFAKEEWQNRINENIDACLAQFGGQRKVSALDLRYWY